MLLLFFFAFVRVAQQVLSGEAMRASWTILLVALDLIYLDEVRLDLPSRDRHRFAEERLSGHVIHVI